MMDYRPTELNRNTGKTLNLWPKLLDHYRDDTLRGTRRVPQAKAGGFVGLEYRL